MNCDKINVMETQISENQSSIMKTIKGFSHAGRGIGLLVKTTLNARIQIVIFIIAIALGLYLHITNTEWLAIIISGGFVLSAEAFNTAIEIDMDLTSPNYHPYARDTKDLAAGAVLIAAFVAALVGLMIFVPYML